MQVGDLLYEAEADNEPALIRESIRNGSQGWGNTIFLDPVSITERAPEENFSGPVRIGISRAVEVTKTVPETNQLLVWKMLDDGSYSGMVKFHSPDAAGLRIGLQVSQLPPRGEIRVTGVDGLQIEVSALWILDTIQLNMEGGEDENLARLYWLPTVPGNEVVLEIRVPSDVSPTTVEVAVPTIMHLWTLPEELEQFQEKSKSCHYNVTCLQGTDSWSRSVARMSYVKGGYSYVCSGALLNNVKEDFTPYFLSANHCISTQVVASTLETWWLYRTTGCNSTMLDSGGKKLRGGATLLYASAETDTSFLLLRDGMPSGVVFAGWSAGKPPIGETVVAIHHPAGDVQKVSIGDLTNSLSCRDVGDGSGGFTCSNSDINTGKYLNVDWTAGITEGGSSGSPVFRNQGGSLYVIGQLYGGSSACPAQGRSVYGRFDVSFYDGLEKWLSPKKDPKPELTEVYRFFHKIRGVHFYTRSKTERDYVIGNYKNYEYEGISFFASGKTGPGLTPIYRFYHTIKGSHFYTSSKGERDHVIATYPQYTCEGVAWYARKEPGVESDPVYRFYGGRWGRIFIL